MATFTVTNTNDRGTGSLRRAIDDANASPGEDRIEFAIDGTVRLDSTLPVITDALTIDGDNNDDGTPEIIISGDVRGNDVTTADGATDVALSSEFGDDRLGDNVRLLQTADAIAVTLEGLILTGGSTTEAGQGGGAVDALGPLTLTNSTVIGNRTAGDDSPGGGIRGTSVGIYYSEIKGNSTAGSDSGGGGLAATATIVKNSTIANNSVSGNSESGGLLADVSGGGVKSDKSKFINATVVGNEVISYYAQGGAISGDHVELTNSTVSGNRIYSGSPFPASSAGGVYASDALRLENSIVLGNQSSDFGAQEIQLGGSASFTVEGRNLVGAAPWAFDAQDIDGVENADPRLVFNETISLSRGGPLTGALRDNGGPVETVALRAAGDNPALDAGPGTSDLVSDARGGPFARVVDGDGDGEAAQDLGAFESQTAAPPLPTPTLIDPVVDTLDDNFDGDVSSGELSLREAIAFAAPGSTITFAEALADGTVTLARGELVITQALTIDGDQRITIDADGQDRAVRIDDGNELTQQAVELVGLRVINGFARYGPTIDGYGSHASQVAIAAGGAILNFENTTITEMLLDSNIVYGQYLYAGYGYTQPFGSGFGGAIANLGEMHIARSEITGNSAGAFEVYSDYFVGSGSGGGVANLGGILTIKDSTIANNSPRTLFDSGSYDFAMPGSGGGVWSRGELMIASSQIYQNNVNAGEDGGFGGGIWGSGNITIYDSTISDNGAGGARGGAGGGINTRGYLKIVDSSIKNNDAGSVFSSPSGGGISHSGPMLIQSSSITGNYARYGYGGGISFNSTGDSVGTIVNSTISNNYGGSIYYGRTFGGAGGINSNGDLRIYNSTIIENKYGGGVSGQMTLTSTLVTGNLVGSRSSPEPIFTSDVIGPNITSAGNNLIGNGDDARGAFVDGEKGDIVGTEANPVDPGLGPLAVNGGPTPTHAVLPGSPAINAGANPQAAAFDQRGDGFDRVVNGQADIGAFERQEAPRGPVIGLWGEGDVRGGSVRVTLERIFVDPVVLIQPLDYDNPLPANWRLAEVAPDGFTLAAQQPNYLGGEPGAADFRYLVLERGAWRLADGTLIEVGTFESDTLAPGGFDDVAFTLDFAEAPAVLSQVQSRRGTDFVTTRQRDVTETGFDLAMQEEEARTNGRHAKETIGWIAIEPGRTASAGSDIEAGATSQRFTDAPTALDFTTDFAGAPAIFANIASSRGLNPAWLRLDDLTAASATLIVDEDQSLDDERGHLPEAVSYLALAGASGELVGAPVEVMGAVQSVAALTHQAQTVAFGTALEDPVIFAGPLSFNGTAPATTRITSITATDVTLAVDEPAYLDGLHQPEQVTVLALEAGVFAVGDGHRLEVGTVTTNLLSSQGFADVVFSEAFAETPVVVAQIQTANGPDWVVARVDAVTTAGFKVAMQEEELLNRGGQHTDEVIGWLAIEPGLFTWSGQSVKSLLAPDLVDHQGADVTLGEALGATPLLAAGLATFNGSDSTNLRLIELANSTARFLAQEEQSRDDEVIHQFPEDVAALAFEQTGLLTGVDLIDV